ncbi:hypothetical protein H257_09911 [Aphanomyces astaci]|uniref:Uncharacterized protein n=1 Tax=Aphanomyces astaci TaxID=112090 RepID=W4G8C4_APHAT|nr:hypothetical protein H257_09911 [Aphanomyces astaci]ETV75952.1 hypothetical protein H257_09911 [Aphanomyces astaci]|eukprot:XP_009834594.1 hypothetical protein H257_09911 [Aphanomyces astaci]
MERPMSGSVQDVELPGNDHVYLDGDRSRSGRSDSPVAGENFSGRPDDRGRPRSKKTDRRQPVAVDEAWLFGGLSSFKPPSFGGPSGAVPSMIALVTEDWDIGQDDVYIRNAPALLNNPFKGSTKEERRAFMASYNQYISQMNVITVNGIRPFLMPLSACIDPATKQRVAEWDMGNFPE